MTNKKFDIIVLGAGPGGYPAAIKAEQGGKSVALVEAKELGGTCLNRGCIPSKALIANAEVYHQLTDAKVWGITANDVAFDYGFMSQRKDKVVAKMRKGLEGLIKANGIEVIRGYGRFVAPKEIEVDGEVIEGDKIIIATGSEPRHIAAFACDHKKILDSTSLLEMTDVPKSLVVVGGGVIGCEFASLYERLGVEVTILEMLPRLLPTESESISQTMTKLFTKRGIRIEVGAKVEAIETSGEGIVVKMDGDSIAAEKALVAVGRMLNTTDIGLDRLGIRLTDEGFVPVNERMETAVPGIYAVGDIVSPFWLAHVATHQGVIAATNAIGGAAQMDYNAIPSVIFTDPEVGSVGLSLEKAREKGFDAAIGNFPFQALGKAQAARHPDGYAQIVVDQKTGQILGAEVVGSEASNLISEMAVAVANELTVECIAETIHAHPTMAEAWMEAAHMATGSPLHMPPKVKR